MAVNGLKYVIFLGRHRKTGPDEIERTSFRMMSISIFEEGTFLSGDVTSAIVQKIIRVRLY